MEPVILPGDTVHTMSEDDFDFTRPQEGKASAPFKAASSRFYNSGAAEMLFRASGREEKFANNQVLFLEDEKVTKGGLFKAPSRMYFVASGEVLLTMGPRPLDTVKKGEIFGEMAVISGRPRSASAAARGDVVTFSMDADELQAAIGRNPEFALMLASVMYDRLRFIATRLAQKKMEPGSLAREATVFEPQLMAQLIASLTAARTAARGSPACSCSRNSCCSASTAASWCPSSSAAVARSSRSGGVRSARSIADQASYAAGQSPRAYA